MLSIAILVLALTVNSGVNGDFFESFARPSKFHPEVEQSHNRGVNGDCHCTNRSVETAGADLFSSLPSLTVLIRFFDEFPLLNVTV